MPRRSAPRPQRPRRLPPIEEPGTIPRILLRFMRQNDRLAWPPGVLLDACDISHRTGDQAWRRLLELRLVVRHSDDDGVYRIVLTPLGRRFPI